MSRRSRFAGFEGSSVVRVVQVDERRERAATIRSGAAALPELLAGAAPARVVATGGGGAARSKRCTAEDNRSRRPFSRIAVWSADRIARWLSYVSSVSGMLVVR
jgi:hypothetical protein